MVKRKAAKRIAPAAMSKEELRARVERRRIERELALQRRIAQLSRELNRQAMRTREETLRLARGLADDQGFSVLENRHAQHQAETIERLSARVAQLEAELEDAVRVGAGAVV